MIKIFYRVTFIILLSLLLGLVVNQLHSSGIPLNLLLSTSPIEKADAGKIYYISVDSALTLLKNPRTVFIDIRSADDFQFDHIRGAINYPLFNLIRKSIPVGIVSDSLVIYDEAGNLEQLKLAAGILAKACAPSVSIIINGYLHWLEQNYPVESGGSAFD
jgi:rhodanese-related sulfurtransferase